MYDWIARRRRDLGLNQGDLADRLNNNGINVTRGTVSHWEKGRYKPPFDDPIFTEAMAKSLEMDVRTILHRLGYQLSDGSSVIERAVALIDAMPPDRQKTALVILEQLSKES